MLSYSGVNVPVLQNIINGYVTGGHLLEFIPRNLSTEDCATPFCGRAYLINTSNELIWPDKRDVAVLIKLGLVEPEEWEESDEGITRAYNLTIEGNRLASLEEDAVLAYLYQKDIRGH
ncbi:MAG: hypothetical protein ACJ74Q_08340 [Pyrinomonadaceae bacterium]